MTKSDTGSPSRPTAAGARPEPAPKARPPREWRVRAGRGEITPGELAWVLDHTLLKADGTPADIRRLCDEARRCRFGAVCVNSIHVPLAARELEGSGVDVCSVVGFPLGAAASGAKAAEAAWSVEHGAREIDMVLTIGHLKAGDTDTVEADIRAVVEAARRAASGWRPVVKVIIETCFLTDGEKVTACRLAARAGADYVKTSGGATVEDVTLMRETVGESLGVKASGGVRDLDTALAMIGAGADRIGLSAGVAVIDEAQRRLPPG